VRRATLIAEGLGKLPSADELMEIQAAEAAFADEARVRDDPNYFPAKTAAGPARLCAMMEESAFWTGCLMRKSQSRAWWRVATLMVIALAALLMALPLGAAGQPVVVGRFLCVVTLFIISRDVLGVALAYGRAASGVHDILRRLQRCAVEGCPEDQLIRLFGDYNSTVEGAPLPRPGLYAHEKDQINGLWATYKATPAVVAGE